MLSVVPPEAQLASELPEAEVAMPLEMVQEVVLVVESLVIPFGLDAESTLPDPWNFVGGHPGFRFTSCSSLKPRSKE